MKLYICDYIIISRNDNNKVRMFESFILASSLQRIARFNVAQFPEPGYTPSYNIRPGDSTMVIVQGESHRFRQFRFGLQRDDQVQAFVRAEGNKNPDDDPGYSGSKAIFLMPEYRKLIRFRRCMIPADAFIVKKSPDCWYLVFLQNKRRPFAFAGICTEDSEGEGSFAVITVPANALLVGLGQKRMPVILHAGDEGRWLKDETPLSGILQSLCICPAGQMNAYPVAAPSDCNNDASRVKPIGACVYQQQQEFQARKQKKSFTSATGFAERRKPS